MTESEKYDVLEKIGHGSFGIIRKVKRKSDGQVLCRKEINYVRMSQKEREQLHAEFAILSSLRHPNIVGYYHREHLKATQDLHLYMEYCGNGDLGRVIKDLQVKKQYAEEGFVWSMFAQLVTALYRCHYGVDPPEAGSNEMGLGNTAKPRQAASSVMILHRDLKPENVFLGADNSVKLGDFGLSKIMQSHDFASTYVGTPFYMSPEICAAERYTLKSDIWSLGCIIYELCSREPPFNAKSHFQLVQKIKEGKVSPLPPVYSPELMAVIKDCLKVNPDRRPDTAQLLNLPVVKLMRKEKEVVEMSRMLKAKEEIVNQRLQEVENKLKRVDADKVQMRQDIEATVRREWEVKACLEIDRQVQIEIGRLQKKFEAEVHERVESELLKRLGSHTVPKDLSSSLNHNDIPLSSVSTSGDGDFPSTTDLTELSMDSPEPAKPLKKSTRTPFARAQTMFAGTPMDVEMGEPSPISIASLSLSPRRTAAAAAKNPTNSSGRNIFAEPRERWQPALTASDSEDEDEEGFAVPPSPTRQKSSKNPFKLFGAAGRPHLQTQNSAPVHKLHSQPNIFAAAAAAKLSHPNANNNTNIPDLRPAASNNALKDRSAASPNRRLSKIPSSSSANLATMLNSSAESATASNGTTSNAPTSPTRKPSFSKKIPPSASEPADLNRLALKNTMALKTAGSSGGAVQAQTQAPKGRTLVELAQARAGGRAVGVPVVVEGSGVSGDETGSPKREGKRFAERMAMREREKVGEKGEREKDREVTTWDPERDEMPSPFLVRQKGGLRRM